jgi:acyl carrier protein
MALMQLLILIEREYAVVLPDSDLTHQNFGTTRRLAKLIQARSEPQP